MKEKRDFKGVWIPKEIWLDKELSIIEKCLLTEISSLDNEKGCFASNKYFSEFFGIGERQISKYISRLQEMGKISVSMIGRNKRSIVIEQKFHQGRNKSSITDRTKVPHNNIVSNTENNPPNNTCEQSSLNKEISLLMEKFKKINPSLNYGNTTQRKACEELIKRFGLEESLRMVERVISAQMEDRYCPRATTPHLFWQKLGDFVIYFNGKTNSNKVISV